MPIKWIDPTTRLEIVYNESSYCPVQLYRPAMQWSYTPLAVNYLRLPYAGSGLIEIRVDGLAVENCSVESLNAVSGFSYAGNRIRFDCPQPGDYVLRINGAFALFLFVDVADRVPPHLAGRPVVVADSLHAAADAADCTSRLQAVIDAAAQRPGGAIVRLPEGHFVVGTIEMRTGVHLHVPAHTTLQGSTDRSLYPIDPVAKGLSIGRCRLIHFYEVEDSGIFGRGVIDGNGFYMRHEALVVKQLGKRITSNLLRIHRSRNIHIENIILRDSEFWNTHILDSEHIRFRNFKIINEIPPRAWDPRNPDFIWNNADGINPDATHDLEVDGFFAYCGDDCMPVKSTGNARDPMRTTENIRFNRCTLISETTVTKIGTETCGPAMRDIRFENLLILDGGSPFGIIVRDGTTVENVTVRNLRALRMAGAVYLHTIPRHPDQQHPAGRIRCLRFENCQIDHADGFSPPPVEMNLQTPQDLQDVTGERVVVDGVRIDVQEILTTASQIVETA